MKSSPPAETYTPGAAVADIKARFAKINTFVMARGGWIVSVPGSPDVTIEVLPNSTLPTELEAAGYDLRPADPPETSRILAAPIEESFTLSSSGAFALAMPGSTAPIAHTVRHAGITRVLRYSFAL
jgi:hypothetical protein